MNVIDAVEALEHVPELLDDAIWVVTAEAGFSTSFGTYLNTAHKLWPRSSMQVKARVAVAAYMEIAEERNIEITPESFRVMK